MSYGTGGPSAASGAESSDFRPSATGAAVENSDDHPAHYTPWQSVKSFYDRNFGLFLVFLAQVFGSLVRARESRCERLLFLAPRLLD